MKVLFIRLSDKLHKEMRELAEKEGSTMQSMGLAAVKQFLDMAYANGRMGDEDPEIAALNRAFNTAFRGSTQKPDCEKCGDTGWVPTTGCECLGFVSCSKCNPEGLGEEEFKKKRKEKSREQANR